MSHKLQMYENLKDMIEREVSEIEHRQDLDKESLDNLFKLTAVLKVVDKYIDREQGMSRGRSMDGRSMNDGYSGRYTNEYSGNSYDGNSYARGGRDGDGDGRYGESRDNFRGYTNRGYGYTRNSGRDRMVDKLHELMNDAEDEQSRRLIQSCIDKM